MLVMLMISKGLNEDFAEHNKALDKGKKSISLI